MKKAGRNEMRGQAFNPYLPQNEYIPMQNPMCLVTGCIYTDHMTDLGHQCSA